jgi:tRNA threonylcarbamoyl adenosine modification protein YeaZ
MTYAIAIHTASPDLGLAISNFADDQRLQHWDLGRSLSTHLHAYLQEFMHPQTWADLQFIAVAKGPGGFTGTRVGVVMARTLAQQLGIPLFGVSTLAAVAHSVVGQGDIAVEMAAQRGEVYGAIYGRQEGEIVPRLVDSVMGRSVWEEKLAQWEQPYTLVVAEAGLGATALNVLQLAYGEWQRGSGENWAEVLPFYGQSPV